MAVRMLRNLLGVEKLTKSSQKTEKKLFADVEVTHNMGIVKYVGEELKDKFKPGQRVHVGNVREEIRIDGQDIMVMEEKNVFAVVEEAD